MPDNCGICAWRCDPVNTQELAGYCYEQDQLITDLSGHCPEWRGTLRDKPLLPGPIEEAAPVSEEAWNTLLEVNPI